MLKLINGLLLVGFIASCSYADGFTAKKNEVNYNVNVDKNVDLRITLSPEKKVCNTELVVFDNDNNEILKTQYMINKGDVSFNAPVSKGQYRLRYRTLSSCGNVKFDIGLTKVSGNFEAEQNDDFSAANKIKELNYNYGYLQRWDDVDYFKVELVDKGIFKLYFEHEAIESFGGYKISILEENKNVLKTFTSKAKSIKDVEKIELNKGTYFIKVEKNDTSSKVQHHRYSLAYVVAK